MSSDSENPSLGPCCVCGGTEKVRTILALHKKCPTGRGGWGCLVCGLPSDGAVAVVCDACCEAPTQLLTTEDVARVWQYDKRTIASWSGRKKSAQISFVRKGNEKRFLWKDVLEHILAHRVQAAYPGPSRTGHPAEPLRLCQEDIERIERLIQLSVKAEVMRELARIMHKEAA